MARFFFWFLTLLMAALLASPGQAMAGGTTPKGCPLNDSHLHYVNFVQETMGMERLLEQMDSLEVEHSMLCGVPVVKKWDMDSPLRPVYYLDSDSRAYWYSATDMIVARAIQALPREQQGRFHPYLCGFNPTDRNAIDHVTRMLEWYPGFWQGIGEIFLRHDDLTSNTYGEAARADNAALDPIYDLAARQDLPVLLHSNIGSVHLHEPIYLPELEKAVRSHPSTRFIWAPAGIGRRIEVKDLPGICDRLLTRYPNLSIDLTSHLYELYLAPGGRFDRSWITVVEKHPGRFMVGSDVVGHFDDGYREHITRNYLVLDELSPATREKVARTNFLAILPGWAGKNLLRPPSKGPGAGGK